MGRGKIQIKTIESSTNRQVTFSKRKAGLFKKAHELTVLCDAQVCLLMLSSTNKFHHYCSPSSNTKAIVDRYRQASGADVWKEQYDKMQKNLNHLKAANSRLRKQIRHRMGEELDDLNVNELRLLEEELEASLDIIRDKKDKQLTTQTETYKRKVKSLQDQNYLLRHQLQEIDARVLGYSCAETYGLKAELGALANGGGQHMYEFHFQPSPPNLHGLGYGLHELRLA